MQIRPDALAAALSRRLPALTWIHGDEDLLVIEAGDLVRQAARAAGYLERLVFQVDRSFKLDALLAETQSLSLFASQRLIELRLANKPTKELGAGLAQILATIDESTRLLISSGKLDRAVTETAWFAALEPGIALVPITAVDHAQLPAWIGQRLAAQQQKADPDTLRMLAERVEGNLLAAHQEVRKLGLLFPTGLLPAAEVRSVVLDVARYDAFGMAQAMLAGDAARTLRALDGLQAEGVAAPLVLWALADAVRNLLRLSQARDAGRAPATLTRELRLYPPRDRLYLEALRRLDTATLRAALQEAARIDRIAKGLIAADPWAAMAALVARMAGAPALIQPA
ncbi:MAG TPA: DNA polymerase III subunit delta [Burkholderiaceae bacterium]|jgi:DNA polymerase-3 subunit delta|nr:DNA polymerase III subunit delta [Burkholderiaceae bacterium]